MPVFVDNIDNEVDLTCVAWATRVYFLDKEGKVHYDRGLGPYGLSLDDLDAQLSKCLGERQPTDSGLYLCNSCN